MPDDESAAVDPSRACPLSIESCSQSLAVSRFIHLTRWSKPLHSALSFDVPNVQIAGF